MQARSTLSACRTPKSPQILELSGIGDKDILEPLGIKTHVHLPGVGTNLQEHYGTFTICGSFIFLCTFVESRPKISSELLPDSEFTTLDMLDDPVVAAEQRAL